MTPGDEGSGRRPPETYVEELKRLAANHVARNVELAARVSALAKEVTSSAASAPAATPAEVLSRWLDFNVASYEALSTHSLALLDGLVAAAERTLLPSSDFERGEPVPAGAPGAADRVELRLSGRRGDRVVAPFMVENRYDRPLEVGFHAGELAADGGAPLPGTLVEFEPATVSLAPRSEAVVQAAVTITDAFAVGETYRTTIRLMGYQARDVALTISVLPPEKEAGPATRPAARKRAPRQRRPPGPK